MGHAPLPTSNQHGNCLEDRRKNYVNCFAMYRAPNNMRKMRTRMRAVLADEQPGRLFSPRLYLFHRFLVASGFVGDRLSADSSLKRFFVWDVRQVTSNIFI